MAANDSYEGARQEKTLRWLSPSVFDSEFTEFERKWVPGTCGWILQTDEYNDWLNRRNIPGRLGLLWISWPAGYGKSFIAHVCAGNILMAENSTYYIYIVSSEVFALTPTAAFLLLQLKARE